MIVVSMMAVVSIFVLMAPMAIPPMFMASMIVVVLMVIPPMFMAPMMHDGRGPHDRGRDMVQRSMLQLSMTL